MARSRSDHDEHRDEREPSPAEPGHGPLTLLVGDDWTALYGTDGVRLAEGHRLGLEDLAQLLGITVTRVDAPKGLGEDTGRFPEHLAEVPGC